MATEEQIVKQANEYLQSPQLMLRDISDIQKDVAMKMCFEACREYAEAVRDEPDYDQRQAEKRWLADKVMATWEATANLIAKRELGEKV